MIGKTISHYKIIEKLGSGGMGVVYKAQDTKLDRFVALKFLPLHLGHTEEEKRRFIHEAKAASALDHPNICTIYEIDETDDGQMFIAMAYYEGETLRDKIARSPLPLDEAIETAILIAQGLDKAHSKEIIHRDIKPANILITTGGSVKIVDFGLARMAGQTKLTKEDTTLGTAAYMSPEQAQGAAVDQRTDLWGLGVVIYEMVTGRQPFEGDYEQAVIYSIMNEEPEPITGLRTGVPMELERIVNKAMAKLADERYQHVDEMVLDLRSIRKELDSVPAKPQPIRRGQLWIRRIALSVGVVILLILMTGTGLYLWQKMEERKLATKLRSEDRASELAISLDKYRIAVLPLANISPDAKDEYFADGMTEELITNLSKIGGLKVIARTSVMQYKGITKSVAEIGRDLQVGTVLEGSVRKAADKLRITVQLIDAQSQEHLWSQDYDRQLADVFAIQSEVARQVAEALQVQLLLEEKRRIEKRATENLEAYTLYLQGRYFWNRRDEHGLTKAIEYFQQAIAKDPNYALAYSGLADSYAMIDNYAMRIQSKDSYVKALLAATKALEIDNKLAEAHASLGYLKMWHEWDWSNAERELGAAIAINPGYATAHSWYAIYLELMGRPDEAIAKAKHALELDPLSLIMNQQLGIYLYRAGLYDQAIEQLEKTLKIDPDFELPYFWLTRVYTQKLMYAEAVTQFIKFTTLRGENPILVATLRGAYAASGWRGFWLTVLESMKKLSQQRYIPADFIASICIILDEKAQALAWLEKAYEERSFLLPWIKVDPVWDSLRAEPRFVALLKKMWLEE